MTPFETFSAALKHTLEIEGEYSNDKMDPGGETYMGISRVYWPHWPGWAVLDDGGLDDVIAMRMIQMMVSNFYREFFWDRFQGDRMAAISPAIAMELFDTAVNLDVPDAVFFLQTAYNVSRGDYGQDLLPDGKLGPITFSAVERYLSSRPGSRQINEEILLNCMNGEQYLAYKQNPRHKYFRGWFRRV